KMALSIVYEDDDLLVIDKPAGLVVHPAAGHAEDTLVNALLAHCGESLSGIGGEIRPGIVHRLDKDTSGLMVVAKNDAAHKGLAAQFGSADGEKTLTRRYTAYLWGVPKSRKGQADGAIGRSNANRKKMAVTRTGKAALTYYEVEKAFGVRAARVSCTLGTGRTHQIRVHMAALGHAVIGDALYGRARGQKKEALAAKGAEIILNFPRQALHAAELSFLHPITGKKLRFTSELPDDLRALEAALKNLV
ncbi:MAG TPA: RluA family pseudouridine synthase, partial [Alphaproteobacteria bacterium]|nr:RluA family pseudouridine synthase [Alphaproteobacteria bacterium]